MEYNNLKAIVSMTAETSVLNTVDSNILIDL